MTIAGDHYRSWRPGGDDVVATAVNYGAMFEGDGEGVRDSTPPGLARGAARVLPAAEHAAAELFPWGGHRVLAAHRPKLALMLIRVPPRRSSVEISTLAGATT